MMERLLADIRHAISTRPAHETAQVDQLESSLRSALAAPDSTSRAYDGATMLTVVQALHRHAQALHLTPAEAYGQAAMVAAEWIGSVA